jgi:hypothetical protein
MKTKDRSLVRVQRLHLFTDDTETYSAFDADDVFKVREELTGVTREEQDERFYKIDDRYKLEVIFEVDDYPSAIKDPWWFHFLAKQWKDEQFGHQEAPAWAWALQGRGFVSSTEW